MRVRAGLAALLLGSALLAACLPTPGSPEDLARFENRIVYAGLQNPTALAFAPDGRVFVAEQSGLVKVFDSLTDTSATIFADLRTQVYNFWDRGLLGLAIDPQFPTRPYVYVLYTYDAAIGGTAPRWGTPGPTSGSAARSTGCRRRRLRRERSAVTSDGERKHRDVGAGADQRLVPAVPEPLDRCARRSAPTARST